MNITEKLLSMKVEQYKAFHSKLMPTVDENRVIGIRIPVLRKFAKELSAEQAKEFMQGLPHFYYEENNLHAALLEPIKDFDKAMAEIEAFLPYVDNWATCDAFCPKILMSQPQRLWDAILRWLDSGEVYIIRYGLVRLLSWYLDEPYFTPTVLDAVAGVTHDDYYVRMAVAWLFSVSFVKQYDATLPYLLSHRLPAWTHNKAIQKAVESYRIAPATKAHLKTLKRKEIRS